MDDNERSIRSLIVKYLVAHTQCSGCGHRYEPQDVRIQERRGEVWVAAVTCSHCGLQGLIMAAIRAKDAQDGEDNLELEAEEKAALLELGPITSDQVLDFHRWLQDFGGDMSEFLEECGRAS